MSTTDKIMELLDNALQSTPEGDVDQDSMGQYLDRCPTRGVELHGGLCRRCHR